MLLFKVLLNIVILTPGAKFMAFEVSDFYLNTYMQRYKYVKLQLTNPRQSCERIQIAQDKEENHRQFCLCPNTNRYVRPNNHIPVSLLRNY